MIAAANAVAREGRIDVSIGKHDISCVKQWQNLAFIPVGKVRTVYKGKSSRREELAFFALARCTFDGRRRIPFREIDFVALELEPPFEQIDLSRFSGTVQAFDSDQF